MSTQTPGPQPQPAQSQQTQTSVDKSRGQRYFTRLIVLGFISVISLLIPCLLFTFHILDINGYSITLSVIGVVVSTLSWFVPREEVEGWLQVWFRHLYHLTRPAGIIFTVLLERDDYFVSYCQDDANWANWIIGTLRSWGYKVSDGLWTGGNYEDEVTIAREKARHIITLFSPSYISLLCPSSNPERWLQHFQRNHRHLKDLPILVCSPENTPQQIVALEITSGQKTHFNPIKLFIPDEEAAKTLLQKRLPKQHTSSSAANTIPSHLLTPGAAPPHFPLSPKNPWTVPEHLHLNQKNKTFIGQSQFLGELHTQLIQERGPSHKIWPLIVTGSEGVGKTRTVIEYAYNHRDYYTSILWLDASSPQTLASSLDAIFPYITMSSTGAVPVNRATSFKASLEAETTRWLLIFDGCREFSVIKDYIPAQGGGHVLITTYDDDMANNPNHSLRTKRLKHMDPDDAVSLLLQRSGLRQHAKTTQDHQEQKREAQAICNDLGYLPLFIAQAGTYISTHKKTLRERALSEYRKLYLEQKEWILQQKDAPNPIPWSLSLQSLQRRSPEAVSFVILCAYLSSDKAEMIPEEIIRQAAQSSATDERAFDRLVQQARSFSLIERDSKGLIMPRLVQYVVRNGLYQKNPSRNEEPRKRAAEQAIDAVNAILPPDTSNWLAFQEAFQKYLPTALACAERIRPMDAALKPVVIQSLPAVRLLYLVGYYHLEFGFYREARHFLQAALDTRSEVGTPEEFPDQATCEYGVAELERSQGNYLQAKQYYKNALEAISQRTGNPQQQVLHPANIDRATVLNGLGRLYEDCGDISKAKEQFEGVLRLSEPHGRDHLLCSALAKNNLAGIYLREHDYKEAERLQKEVYQILFEELKLPATHPCVSHYYANRATYYALQKQYRMAEQDVERALHTGKQILGASHPQIAIRLSNQGLLYFAQGNNDGAKECCRKVLEIYQQFEDSVGNNHPSELYFLESYRMVLESLPEKDKDTDLFAEIEERGRKICEKQIQQNSSLVTDKQGENTGDLLARVSAM